MTRTRCSIVLLSLLCSLVRAQPLDSLRQAVDGDATTWSRAIEETVTRLKQTTPMTDPVVWALAQVMEIETLRPTSATAAPPDAAKAQRIRDLVTAAETYLIPGGMPPPPPPPPNPLPTSGNAALDALRRGPMPPPSRG